MAHVGGVNSKGLTVLIYIYTLLKGFAIKVRTPNGPVIFEQSVLSWIKEYTITGLNQCQEYEVEILAHCSAGIYITGEFC